MSELIVDFITSLDGYASAEGWPGWWGLEGREYLAWLDERPDRDHTILMGANTYRLMYGLASASEASGSVESAEGGAMAELTRLPKVVFSSTLEAPLAWANTQLVSGDAIAAPCGQGGDRPRRRCGGLAARGGRPRRAEPALAR